jgi:magnesium transporter
VIAEVHIARGLMEAQPERAAMTLEQLPVAQAAAVLRAVPASLAATVLRGMNVTFASECLTHLVAPETANVGAGASAGAAMVAELSVDDATGILRAMEPTHRDPLLGALSDHARGPIERVLPYAAGTAGSVMDPAVFRLPDDVLVVDARGRLSRAAKALLYYVYIVDREHRLVGVLDIPELMLARPRDPVSAAMHRDVERINVLAPVALVREHAAWQSFHALPVVDDEDRLLGAIRYQTLRRLERDATGRGPAPAQLTAGALAELFQLGTNGFVAGIAATTGAGRELDRPVATTGDDEPVAKRPDAD